jgi:hypothetical protein
MDWRRGFADRVLCRGAFTLVAVLATATIASAQAWVPPAGVGSVNVLYQTIDNTSHILADGSRLDGYDSLSRGILLEIDYALTDRFSLSAGLPYIAAKYLGPLPSFSALPIDECHCWNSGWQDFGITARYNLANGSFALTPSVSFGVPSNEYSYFGEAVVGRNLKEIRVGLAAGQRLDAISPRLAVQGHYSYAFVERVFDVPNNRSNAAVESSFMIARKLSARAVFSWQRTHGGLLAAEFTTPELFEQFDRLVRDNNFHIGAGASYSFPRVDVFVSYVHYVTGEDTHAGRAITAGLSWPFQLR